MGKKGKSVKKNKNFSLDVTRIIGGKSPLKILTCKRGPKRMR